jgi:hypothetical protein
MKMKPSINRRKNLIAAGVYSAASLRIASRKAGVPGIGDFLNGLLLAALVLEIKVVGEGDFVEIFKEEAESIGDVLRSKTYREVRDEIGEHVVGEVIGDKLGQSAIVSKSSEVVMMDIADDLGATKDDMLRMVAFAVLATVCAVSKPENREEYIFTVARVLDEKREASRSIMAMDDDEFFGDNVD